MLKTRDLTDPAWQASMTDAQIASVIGTGKGKMPAFQLPAPTVQALVELIRAMKASTGHASPGGGSGAASALPNAARVSEQPLSAASARGSEDPYTGSPKPREGR
jgi:hypothetical protein